MLTIDKSALAALDSSQNVFCLFPFHAVCTTHLSCLRLHIISYKVTRSWSSTTVGVCYDTHSNCNKNLLKQLLTFPPSFCNWGCPWHKAACWRVNLSQGGVLRWSRSPWRSGPPQTDRHLWCCFCGYQTQIGGSWSHSPKNVEVGCKKLVKTKKKIIWWKRIYRKLS